MKNYILTGTPGSGKTTLIQVLKLRGYNVVAEAATDTIAQWQARGIAEPWKDASFIDAIVALQHARQLAQMGCEITFYDRSPLCTYALAIYLGFKPSGSLLQEIERIERDAIYNKCVFFIKNLGFCTPTLARQISFKESLIFETIHQDTYQTFGYECIMIPPLSISERIERIVGLL